MLWREKVANLMQQRQMTQKDLAQKSGITEASVSRYMHSERTPRMDIIVNFAKAFGVSTEYLLEEDGEQGKTAFEAISESIARNGSNLTDTEKTKLISILLGKGD